MTPSGTPTTTAPTANGATCQAVHRVELRRVAPTAPSTARSWRWARLRDHSGVHHHGEQDRVAASTTPHRSAGIAASSCRISAGFVSVNQFVVLCAASVNPPGRAVASPVGPRLGPSARS